MADVEANEMSGEARNNIPGLRAILAMRPIRGIIPLADVPLGHDETHAIILESGPGKMQSLRVSPELVEYAYHLTSGRRDSSLPLTLTQPEPEFE